MPDTLVHQKETHSMTGRMVLTTNGCGQAALLTGDLPPGNLPTMQWGDLWPRSLS
ncbi:hypothetical protein Rcae01_02377 [Novipirellula caenicola]|uniref:Uncharacterized protein n=1 Tax=Novipirellula caenicola TaxID=1536901 RepID=A0ABP9VP24_9BACT